MINFKLSTYKDILTNGIKVDIYNKCVDNYQSNMIIPFVYLRGGYIPVEFLSPGEILGLMISDIIDKNSNGKDAVEFAEYVPKKDYSYQFAYILLNLAKEGDKSAIKIIEILDLKCINRAREKAKREKECNCDYSNVSYLEVYNTLQKMEKEEFEKENSEINGLWK